MAYSKVNWQNSPSTATPINASNLNHMDDQIADNESRIETLETGTVSSFNGRQGTVTPEDGDYSIEQIAPTSGATVGQVPMVVNNGTPDNPDLALELGNVNDGTLTIQKNGATVQTFSANQSANATANIPSDTTETTDTEPYVLRQGKGDLVDMEIVGASVAWNQLVQNGNFADTSNWNTATLSGFAVSNNEATFTATARWGRIEQTLDFDDSHVVFAKASLKGTTKHYLDIGGITKYLTVANTYQDVFLVKKGGLNHKKISIGDGSASDFEACYVKNVVFIDLTASLGTTIADYIYSLEQNNAGDGVAWFRQYFPEEYYAYDAGSIQSVCAGARKVYDADNNLVATYPLDSSKELRGLFQLVNGKLKAYGDVYANGGSITRKYGIVDLGTLTYTYDSGNTRFGSANFSALAKLPSLNSQVANIICPNYVAVGASSTSSVDKSIGISTGGKLLIHDSAYTDPAIFKAALSGIYLVYEKATPTTESADPYQNPQRAYADGTEEFIDYGVSQSSRDVAIPCGHNSTYTANDVVQPIADYVDNIPIMCKETTPGTYTLTATVDANGNVTYAWA